MKRIACALLMGLVLAGCGSPASSNTGAAATASAGSNAVVTTTAAPAATTAPAATPLSAGSVEEKALQALAKQTGVEASALQLTDKEAQEWSDSSLGCPDPAALYLQVITPGYKLTFSDGTKSYAVHTDDTASRLVLCERGRPAELGAVAPAQ